MASGRGYWFYVLALSALGVVAGVSAFRQNVWYGRGAQNYGGAYVYGAVFAVAMTAIALFAAWKIVSDRSRYRK